MPKPVSHSPERTARRPRPWGELLTPAVTTRGRLWDLSGHVQLSSMRRDARGLLAGGIDERGDDAREEAAERAVLVLDELASNALRHGQPPVTAQLFDRGDTWLVVVTDAATTDLPVPAVGRSGELGGFGLYVVEDLAIGHGVDVRAHHKCVWAELPTR